MFSLRADSPKSTGSCNPCSSTSKSMNAQESARSRYTLPNFSTASNVYLRIKPKFTEVNEESCTVLNSTTLIVKKSEHSDKKFSFTKIFESETLQADLFDHSVRQRVVAFLFGESSTIVAYGASNSGKTYTLYGTTESPGVIPHSIKFLFSAVNSTLVPWYKVTDDNQIVVLDDYEQQQEAQLKHSIIKPSVIGKDESMNARSSLDNSCLLIPELEDREIRGEDAMSSVWLSFAQIYNDKVYDLLVVDDQERYPLKLTVRKDGSTYVKGLKSVHVITGLEACQLLVFAQSRMKVASTALNDDSSQSHTFAMIRLLMYKKKNATNEVQVSTLTFCDVAASGRFNSSIETTSLTKLRSIENSLLVLRRCLKSVCDSHTSGNQVIGPFRESKLTRILQNALTGRENICFVVTVDIADILSLETMGALNISSIARRLGFGSKEFKRGYVSETTPRNPKMSFLPSVVHTSEKTGSFKERENLGTATSKYEGQTESEDNLCLVCKELRDENERLIEKLETLESERMKHELEIRHELSNQHLNIIKKLEASWAKRVQNIENQEQDLLKWSVNHVKAFYKERIDNLTSSKKRSSCDNDESSDESQSIYEDLEIENAQITSKVVVLRETVCSLKSENESLRTDKNKYSLELALVKQKLMDVYDTIRTHFPEFVLNVEDKSDSVLLVDGLVRAFVEKIKNIEMLEKDLSEAKDNCASMTSTLTRLEKELQDTRIAFQETLIETKDLENELYGKINFTHDLQKELQSLKKELVELRKCQANYDKSKSIEKCIDDSTRKCSSVYSNDFFCNDDIGDTEPITQAHVDTKMEHYFTFNNKKSSKKVSLNDSDADTGKCHDDSMKEDSGIDSSCRSRRSTSVCDSLTPNNITVYEKMEQLKIDNANLRKQYMEEKEHVTELLQQVDDMKDVIRALKEVSEFGKTEIREFRSSLTMFRVNTEDLVKTNSMKNENYDSIRLNSSLSELSVLREQMETLSVKCRAEHVSKIEELEKEVVAKTLELNEINGRMTEAQSDLSRVHRLHEKVNELETVLEKCLEERNNYRKLSQEHLETQSMLEIKLKCLLAEIQSRDRELISLRTELNDATLTNTANSEKAKNIYKQINETNETMLYITSKLVRFEQVRERLEKMFEEGISNMQIRLSTFAANTAFLNRVCEENESVDGLKLQLLEKEREIELFKRDRNTMTSKYECLVGKLRIEIDKRIQQSIKFKKLFLLSISRRHSKFVGKKHRKLKVSCLREPMRRSASAWLTRASRRIEDKESVSIISRCSTGQQRHAQSLCSYSSDKNETFDTGSLSNTERSYSTEGSSRLNNCNAEVCQIQSDASDCSEACCRCCIGFKDAQRQGRMSGWMKIYIEALKPRIVKKQLSGHCTNARDSDRVWGEGGSRVQALKAIALCSTPNTKSGKAQINTPTAFEKDISKTRRIIQPTMTIIDRTINVDKSLSRLIDSIYDRMEKGESSTSMNMDSYRDCRMHGYHDEENGGFHSVEFLPRAQRRRNAELNDCHCCHFYGH
ncbi:kinesin-like protein KIF20B [Colletes gigas]|uniref:kinesin-like protein KIF20B n=1 Tax=Colletes gigas TaxID=935657 RepID=UPI001C9B74FD|nr:kinesin-like protein KIF20B [Colletes gigas]